MCQLFFRSSSGVQWGQDHYVTILHCSLIFTRQGHHNLMVTVRTYTCTNLSIITKKYTFLTAIPKLPVHNELSRWLRSTRNWVLLTLLHVSAHLQSDLVCVEHDVKLSHSQTHTTLMVRETRNEMFFHFPVVVWLQAPQQSTAHPVQTEPHFAVCPHCLLLE